MIDDLQPIATDRYRPITVRSLRKTTYWNRLPSELQEALIVTAQVLPFRTNEYVLEQLIDWSRIPEDPIYQLTFLQPGMLDDGAYREIRGLLRREAPGEELHRRVDRVRRELNPHPDGQTTLNVPRLDGRPIPGLQHKYRETVLFFPAHGQTCHAYCTYCFRWAQFVDLPEIKFQGRETRDLVGYLAAHPDVTDVLFTGGDPMIMKSRLLRRYVEPLLAEPLETVRHIRFGTKALAYWPQRFVSDDDADDLLRLFEEIVASGRHVAVMAHFSHPAELGPAVARRAIERIRATGAEIRMQAPLVRHVNDRAAAWAELWQTGVGLGMIPYYMFVERDTGPRNYFEVPLARAHRIFRDALSRVSGLARSVRGPSMSALPGKVRILGTTWVGDERCFVLDFLQARNPDWVRRPFFARFDPEATWLDDLQPASDAGRFFYEDELAERFARSPVEPAEGTA
jgi:KamA family protein